MTGAVILQIVLIALNAVFTCAETAVVSLNDNKLEFNYVACKYKQKALQKVLNFKKYVITNEKVRNNLLKST